MILQSDWSLPHNRDKLCFNLYVKLFLRWAAHTVRARDELRGEYEGYSDSASTQHILIDILLSHSCIHKFYLQYSILRSRYILLLNANIIRKALLAV